jgi:methionyl-tRNA formyltransferase
MSTTANNNLIAIGRSRYLYDAIVRLAERGYPFKAIVTEEAYDEYDVKHADFERLAVDLGCAFFMTKDVNADAIRAVVAQHGVRVAISANWKYTIPSGFLDLFECGVLNFHLGNLPDYKGNATLNWSIINGETHVNGNIHKMAPVLDAGDVVVRKSIPITPHTYVADLIHQAEMDAPAMYEEAVARVLADPHACEIKGTTRGLRCYPRLPEDGLIDWREPAEAIGRLVRASSRPYQGAFSFLNGERVTIWRAAPLVPADRYLAVPGHVIEVNAGSGHVTVACGSGFLQLQEIERNEELAAPAALIRSIRLRFK